MLDRPASTSADVLGALLAMAEDFDQRYEAVARSVAEPAHRTILCTIYEVQLEPAPYAQLARVPLALLNDRIVRTGARLGLDVLELRSVCTEPADFVLQIEPSARGAARRERSLSLSVSMSNGGPMALQGKIVVVVGADVGGEKRGTALRSGFQALMLIRPDGTESHRIQGHGLLPSISWSPDSKWISGYDGRGTLVDVRAGIMSDLSWGGRYPAWRPR